MKTLHLSIIVILTSSLVMSCNCVFADNVTTSYGGLVGWRQADFKSDHGNYPIWYKITNGTVISTPLDLPSKTLFFMIKAPYDGQLIIQLPRSTIDSKNQGIDQPYSVAVRGTTGLSKINATETSDDYMRTLKINFTKYTSEIEIVGTFFVESHQPMTKNPHKLSSPLNQFKSGIAANDVKCEQGLQLVIKAEDGFPSCVKPDTASKLVERGWAKEIVTNTSTESSTLNKTTTNELKIDLSNQTYEAGYPVTTSLDFITHDPDCQLPSVLVTNLSTNMSVYGPVLLWSYTNAQCSNSTRVSFYAGLENNQLITNTERYQIMATIYGKQYQREFTVVPSEYSGKNITAESTLLPGSDPWLSCPAIPGSRTSETILGTSGFDGVYHRYLTDSSPDYEVDDYFLKPGHSGKITIKIHPGSAFPVGDNLATGELILNKNSHFGNFAHVGINTRYEPSVAIAGLDGSATLSLVISTMHNATHGTYWMYLPPGGCVGGDLIFLTIGDRPMAQPPDLIGYDTPVDFSFSESPLLTADVINFGIHTFNKCSLTYDHDNKTTLIENFDEIPPGFQYKHHFDSNPVTGDKVTFECVVPHVVKTYSPD